MTSKDSSFWKTLPGILTGSAALVTAIVGLLALFLGNGHKPAKITLADWATQANAICSEGYTDIRALGIPSDSISQFRALPETLRISTRANQKLQALAQPEETAPRIDEALKLSSQANIAAQNAYNQWTAGDAQDAQAQMTDAQHLTNEVQRIDSELDAGVCAQGP